jgi:arylformamidase
MEGACPKRDTGAAQETVAARPEPQAPGPSDMEVFDLTLPLRPGMPVEPGDPPVEFERVRSHETDGFEVAEFRIGSHAGTHVDAPRHFFAEGATLDQYPIDRFVGAGVVLDCRRESVEAAGAHEAARPYEAIGGVRSAGKPALIDAQVLTECLSLHPLPPGGFALLWTEGALLTLEAAQLLVAAGAGLVGTDGPSLDKDPYPVHRLLLGAGMLLVENLYRLDRLGPGPVTCAFLPLAVIGTDGAPVRAVAWR